ncbi:MAG: hypothetical protein QM581_03440 [Pseudomonas sp.]
MKALKSQLAKDVLADPRGKQALRRYLASATTGAPRAPQQGIEVKSQGRTIRVYPVVVPKAD